jgi:HSP20 family protein
MTTVKTNKNGNLLPSLWSDFFDNDKFFDTPWLNKDLLQTLPAVNVKENGREFGIEFAAPGFKKSDFKIHVDQNQLTISAEKENEKNESDERYTRKEFSYNSFSRTFTLPQNVNTDTIDAKYHDGILKLSVPKKEVTKALPKKEIKVA